VNNALSAIADYGVTVGAEANSGDLEELIKQIANPLPIGRGGTGATDALTARTNLMIKIGTENPPSTDETGTIYIKYSL
jgi:hypothetical protein